MILVDSSVWIAYLKGSPIPQVEKLNQALQNDFVLMCEVVSMEVLRGISNDQQYKKLKNLFLTLEQVEVSYKNAWMESVDWYRTIRKEGYTVRYQMDILLALFCHKSGVALLHNDRDFDLMNEFYPFKMI
jgi:predicted nucleic acid-binding protein